MGGLLGGLRTRLKPTGFFFNNFLFWFFFLLSAFFFSRRKRLATTAKQSFAKVAALPPLPTD